MPIYEYICRKCGKRFELRRNMDDSDNNIKCPLCGKENPERVFSCFGTALSSHNSAPITPT